MFCEFCPSNGRQCADCRMHSLELAARTRERVEMLARTLPGREIYGPVPYFRPETSPVNAPESTISPEDRESATRAILAARRVFLGLWALGIGLVVVSLSLLWLGW